MVETGTQIAGKSATLTGQTRTLRDIIAAQAAALLEHFNRMMRSDDVEAVHKMRVTTRRLQASLDLLQSGDDEERIIAIKKQLRRWRRQLSRVRNYDVFLDILAQADAKAKKGRRQQHQALREELAARRAARAAEAREFFAEAAIQAWLIEFGLMRAPGPQSSSNGNSSASPEADRAWEALQAHLDDEARIAQHTADRLEQRTGEFIALAARTHNDDDPAQVHQLRIAAKRLRYLFEVITETGYGNALPAIEWLRRLQDRIGDWHDLESLETEILDIVSQDDYMKLHLAKSSDMLAVAARFHQKKKALAYRIIPVAVPARIANTSRRLTRSLRRIASAA